MIEPDEARRRAIREAGFKSAAVFVLLGRNGGRATFTEEEYEEIANAYGGTARVAIHIEVVRTGDSPREIQLTLINKPANNAELVS